MADDVQVKREITLEADAETMEKMRKKGHAREASPSIAMKQNGREVTTQLRHR
jgi:hypothetical protein